MATDFLLNRYRILERLGEGAMGAVWLVEDEATAARLAMKVLGQAMGDGPAAKLQLKQEFRVMTQLRHPNCCAVYDYGQLPDGAPFFTMELVPGQGLDAALPLGPEELREALVQLALALSHVHQLGYVHMDLKPENVRLRPDGVLKLMDYGLMEPAGRSGGAIRGTLGYLAPEVIKRGPVDARADLYALGAVAYELWTGQTPFVRPNPLDVLRAHVQEEPVPPGQLRPGLPEAWEGLILKLLAKDPLHRCQSASEVIRALGAEAPEGLGGSLLASPLVGREEALAALQAAVNGVAKFGKPRHVWVEGGPGLGKSRLLAEMRYLAQLEDVAVAVGAAPKSPVPFGAIAKLLGDLLPLALTHVPELLQRLASVLVKLRPELGVAPEPELDPPAREKFRLVDAVTELILAIALAKPLVLVLEDWQSADALALECFEHLLRNQGEAPLLVVVGSREVPPAQAKWAEDLTRVVVQPLDAPALWAMLSSMLGTTQLDGAFVRQVSEWSARVPRDVEGLLDHWVRQGHLRKGPEGQWLTAAPIPPEALPRGLDGLAMAKLEGLSAGALALARAAAVVGAGGRLDDVAELLAWSESHLLDAASELDRADVLRPVEGGALAFGDDRLAELLAEGSPPEERQAFQGALVAKLLEECPVPSEAPGERLALLVRHLLVRQAPVGALRHAVEHGRRRTRLFALAEARQVLEACLALVPEGDAQLRMEVLHELGEATRVPSPKEAIVWLTEAMALAEGLGDQARLGPGLTSLAKAHQLASQQEEALVVIERAAMHLQAQGASGGLARCWLTKGRLLFFRGRVEEATQAALAAAQAAEQAGEAAMRGAAYALAGYFGVAAGQPESLAQGIQSLDEALGLLEAANDKMGLLNALNLQGNARNALGEPSLAQAAFDRTWHLAKEVGSGDDEMVALINLATCALELGQAHQAKAHAKEALALATARGTAYAQHLASILGAQAALQCGQLAGARAQGEAALAGIVALNNPYVEALVRVQWVELLWALGDPGGTHEAAVQLHALMERTGNREPALRLHLVEAQLLLAQGSLGLAGERAAWALAEAQRSSVASGVVRASLCLAQVALADGAWAQAQAHLLQAQALAEGLGLAGLAAQAALLRGDLALLWGRRPVAEVAEAYERGARWARPGGLSALVAWANFGLAACEPEGPSAGALGERAQDELLGLLRGLEEAEAGAWRAQAPWARILEGDRWAWSLPKALADRQGAMWRRLSAWHPGWAWGLP